MTSFQRSIAGATALVRGGRLSEATDLIRRSLAGSGTEGGAEAPMRDVTPRPPALPGPAGAEGRNRPTGAGPERKAAPATGGGVRAGGGGASDPGDARAAPDPKAAPRPTGPSGRAPWRAGAGAAARPAGLGADALASRLTSRFGTTTGASAGLAEPAAAWARPRGAAAGLVPPDGARFEERRHDGPHGAMGYRLYVPASLRPGAPLVVMLHGCTQDPDDFARGTGMNGHAEATGALVAYPRQEASRNPNRCWSWFEPAQTGEAGEAGIVASLAREVSREAGGDPGRVFAAGLSAGGAMAAALGAAHPGTFRAVGVHSGLPAGAASDMGGAFAAMSGRGGGTARPLGVPAIVFHGLADRTVAPVNAERIARAGRDAGAKPRLRRGEANGRSYERATLRAEPGAGAVELWRVEGLGHAWSGGSAQGSYADPAGPDASREMMRFFLEAPG